MCGIAGVFTFDQVDRAAIDARVARMVAALEHRGPDGRGSWSTSLASGQVIALGHTRLAVIDLSDAARQPMTRGAASITFNGEIYNFKQLRGRLRDTGAQCRTGSDTEVLLAAHAAWGDGFLDSLDGMFAFALWTGDRLLLARDRFGIKPLYVFRDDRVLVFASEVRALLASGYVRPALNEEGIWHYFGYQTTPTPETLVRGVQMLAPGSLMTVGVNGQCATRKYWDLWRASQSASVPGTEVEARRTVSELLQEAVTAHLISDVPVGLFLSGGIDSAAILSAATTAGVRARTFTVALDGFEHDESAEAKIVARHFRADHTEIRLDGGDLAERMPGIVSAIDHPSGDGVNTFVVSEAVRNHGYKVALSGLGGDEVFGGYPSFHRMKRLAGAASRLQRTPAPVRRLAATVVRTAGGGAIAAEKAAAVLDSGGSIAAMWPVTRQLYSVRVRDGLLASGVPRADDAYANMLEAAFGDRDVAEVYGRVSYAEARTYMHDVLLRDTDQMSMAHALEVRVPLLDHRLAAFVVALPDAWKTNGAASKPLLAGALRAALPLEIASSPKRGFTLPFDAWMRGPLRAYCERQLGDRGLDGRGLLRAGESMKLWRRFISRAPGVTWGRIWSLVALNAWLERRSL